MLTGRQEWMSRGWGNAKFDMGDDITWMSILRDHGYRCVSVGKTHMIHAGSYHIQVPVRSSFSDQNGWDHFHPKSSPEPEETYFDIHTTQRACDALRRLKNHTPFAIFIGFHAPHEPYVMPARYLELIDPAAVPLPTARREDEYHRKSESYRTRVEHFRKLFGGIDDEMTRVGIAGHHCLLKMVDDCLGSIMEEIQSLGLIDDTVVVFCSDHGDLLGEHWLFNKAATFYESEIRIPMMFRFPDGYGAGKRVKRFGSGIDIMPTLLDILGIEVDISLPGISLMPAVRDNRQTRESVVCTNTRGMMIRTSSKKLWYECVNRDGEMYDLDQDPEELENLYCDQDHTDMRHELLESMIQARLKDDRLISRPNNRNKIIYQEVRSSFEPET